MRIKERVDFVMKGCRCKTGCITNRCKCKKSTQICGPSCQCINCANTYLGGERGWDKEVNQLEVEGQEDPEEENAYYLTDEDDLDENYLRRMDEDEELQTIMEMVFGNDEEDEILG